MQISGTALVSDVAGAGNAPVTRAERLLAGRNRLLELIAADATLEDVLESLAGFIESQTDDLLCSILLLSEGRLHHGAAPSLPEPYRLAIEGAEIGPDVGSCGHAAYTGEEAIATDIASDRRWVDYREVALRHGLRSCWSTAIHARSGEILGTFAMYHHTPYEPVPEDRELVAIATRIAAIAIERARADHALKAQTAASLAADLRKDEFLAMLAHELRGPLAPVLNAIELVTRDAEPESATARAAAIIERQARHLMRLVDDLLDVSRITRGKISLRPIATTVEEILARALEMAQPVADAGGVELVTRPSPAQRLDIDADPVRLTQAVFNVLSNAVKFTPRGGTVEVGAAAADGGATISIVDTGVGIAPGLLSSIFELFQQGEQSLDRSRGGLGIGLTVAKRLVEMHGGRIAAHSEGIGRGTELTLWLPLATRAPERARPEPPVQPSTPRRRVLVVDDNADGAEMVAMGLERPEHEVRIALDGASALAIALDWRPDVVVLDIGLPGMDGFEVARQLRAQPGGDHPLIVGVTGYGEESYRERSKRAGFDLHLVKPVAISELVSAIATAH